MATDNKIKINENETKNKTRREKGKYPKVQFFRKVLQVISFVLFPVTFYYLSPYLSIMGPIVGVISGSIIIFGSLLVYSIFMGRTFCSYLCPMGGLQDFCMTIRKRRINIKTAFVKWIIFIPWLAALILLPIFVGGPWQGVDFLFMTRDQPVIGISLFSTSAYIVYYFVLALILTLAFAVGKRSFCHHVCWIAPFMVIGRKIANWLHIPSFRLKAENEKCIHCNRCTRICPMSLPVEELVTNGDMEHPSCILCGQCVEECPKDVIDYAFTSKQKAATEPIAKQE
jgi:polyferredoxin